MIRTVALNIAVDADGPYGPHEVYLTAGDTSVFVGERPYDGSVIDEVIHEVTTTLADMLREALGWPTEPTEDPFPDTYDDVQAIHP